MLSLIENVLGTYSSHTSNFSASQISLILSGKLSNIVISSKSISSNIFDGQTQLITAKS